MILWAALLGCPLLVGPAHARSPSSASFEVRDARFTPAGGRQSSTHFAVPCAGILPAQGRSSSANFVVQAGCGTLHKAVLDAPVLNETPEFTVLLNAPNPFSNSTRFEYRLPGTATLCVDIFDTLGRLVRRARQAEQPSGWHVFDWDGRDETLDVAELPPHTHDIGIADSAIGGLTRASGTSQLHATFPTSPTGGGQPHAVVQPTIVFNKIIKT